MNTKVFVLVNLLIYSPLSYAQTKICAGEVIDGTSDSAVGDCSFLSNSKIAKKIYEKCHLGDFCEVKAHIRKGTDDLIDKIYSVKTAINHPYQKK
jgi:hypothetical protein